MSQRTRTEATWLMPRGGALLPTGERARGQRQPEQGRQPGRRRD